MAAEPPCSAPYSSSVREYEVWCPDEDLLHRGHRLVVGETTQIDIQPTSREVLQSLAAIWSEVPHAYWSLATQDERVAPVVQLSGTISRLRSVTTPFVFRSTRWEPAMKSAQTRLAGSTHVHPGRSVWAPSGAPVLLGYLVTLTRASIITNQQVAA